MSAGVAFRVAEIYPGNSDDRIAMVDALLIVESMKMAIHILTAASEGVPGTKPPVGRLGHAGHRPGVITTGPA